MNVLLIPEVGHYRDWIGKTYNDILIHFKNNSIHNVKIIYTNQRFTEQEFKMFNPTIVIFFDTDTLRFAKKFDFIFNMNVPVIASSLDLFNFDKCIADPYIQKCQGILHFSKVSKLLDCYKQQFPNKYINSFNARFVNTCRFKNYNNAKKYDILIYGSRVNYGGKFANAPLNQYQVDVDYVNKWETNNKKKILPPYQFYPLRFKMEELLLKNKHKYNLKILPNKCIYDATIANEDLSKLINESHMTLACCTRANICMSKYFEISASYSAILGDIPTDYESLLKNNMVEINEWMSDNEILSIIDNALKDKQQLWEMTKRLGDIVQKECNLEEGTKNMDHIIEDCYNVVNNL